MVYVNLITDTDRALFPIKEEELDKFKQMCYNNNYYYMIVRTNGGEK
tara:strand:+ start:657 stop:797 length:141 start_codon:yes stop_codon:yes gene_type:complete